MASGVTLAGGSRGEAQRVVVLIGFMGAGKSTAARGAAELLHANALDVDQVLEQRLGKSISTCAARCR